ncbi:MAG: hypothetical protein NZ928_02105 [Endomicrobia bacterium]|nr:hypothetical protein [Endomicrobiia bacterium]MCX7940273.1 hypothetical protein [Endomicrobiia bacterium]MDW8055823.1 regulatory iron-sulfur-containing complex subunit RicT [Elusimicrobiota bacterium]
MHQRHIVNVKLSDSKEVLAENIEKIDLKIGDKVVVFIENTYDVGVVSSEEKIVEESKIDKKNLYKLIRKVNQQDIQRIKENLQKSQEVLKTIKQVVKNYDLPIKVVQALYSFDRTKLYVYYTQEKPVNLKKLIHELAHKFKIRIEMKQIGVRDETKILGGIGVCGYELCCKRWIKKFESISVEMAKVQQLTLNIPKLSGLCNRLKCCLFYEYQFYKEAVEKFPKIGGKIKTPDGEGKVIGIDCIKELVTVELKTEDGETYTKNFNLSQVGI